MLKQNILRNLKALPRNKHSKLRASFEFPSGFAQEESYRRECPDKVNPESIKIQKPLETKVEMSVRFSFRIYDEKKRR